MSDIRKINKSISKGVLPDCLNFSLEPSDGFDWGKIKYNAFYRSYEYVENKFPPGYESIPGFDKVIEMCIPEATPLEEMTARQMHMQMQQKKNED